MKKKSGNNTQWFFSGFLFTLVLSATSLSVGSLQAGELVFDSRLSEKATCENIRERDTKQAGQTSRASDTIAEKVQISIKKMERNSVSDTICTPGMTFTIAKSEHDSTEQDKGAKRRDNAAPQPLIIVDSKILLNKSDLDKLDPTAIDNISVLKGERAITAYGEKGKNGVIVITTKKWKEAKDALKETVVGAEGDDSGKKADTDKSTEELIPQRSNNPDGKVALPSGLKGPDLKPLIIVDGLKMGKDFDPGSIKPENIESVSVLKDKSATGIYGEEGKNGVIIITTK